jgi:hypothetical protein
VLEGQQLSSRIRILTTTPIMSNNPASMVGQEKQLILPVVRVQRPSMREDNDWARLVAPVFVVDLGSIFGGDKRHDVKAFWRA